MKSSLIKYKNIKLLIDSGLPMAPLLENIEEIAALSNAVAEHYEDILSASASRTREIQQWRQKLISKVGYKIVGAAFTDQEAELYALDRGIEYEILELY